MFTALRKHAWDAFLSMLPHAPSVHITDEETGHTLLSLALAESAPERVIVHVQDAMDKEGVPQTQRCEGCKHNAPGQRAHMMPGGCLSDF